MNTHGVVWHEHVSSFLVFFTCLLSQSCRRFVCGGSDMWVRLHDYETGQELDVCKGELRAAAPAPPACVVLGVCVSLRARQRSHACTHACLCGTVGLLPGRWCGKASHRVWGAHLKAPFSSCRRSLACAASSFLLLALAFTGFTEINGDHGVHGECHRGDGSLCFSSASYLLGLCSDSYGCVRWSHIA